MKTSRLEASPFCFSPIFLVFIVSCLDQFADLQHAWGLAVLPGSWELIIENGGVSAMHMTLTPENTVIMFDRTDYGPSQIKLPGGHCRNDSKDLALKVDCYAHSIELNLSTDSVRPLKVLTDTWCSSGAFLSNGTFVSTGGYNDGAEAIRYFIPCSDGSCDWYESSVNLGVSRWYASNQILPDNRIIVVGGRRAFSYEFVPPGPSQGISKLQLLSQTNVPNVENNLYPFLHLSSDGNLFIFANRKSILFDYKNNRVVKTFPDISDGGRNYPSSGSSVMLPLSPSDNYQTVEIMICGGAPDGSFQLANNQTYFMDALRSCGRMIITDPSPSWEMEDMPSPRVMGDMLILPTGEILIINGAQKGTAGWYSARQPVLSPFLYNPSGVAGQRFQVLAGTAIPRLYHSSANVLPDGRVLVGGSNPNILYAFSGVLFETELRLETYNPYYLDASFDSQRPVITSLSSNTVSYNSTFTVHFSVSNTTSSLEFRIYAPPFTTHSYSMNQRQLILAASLPTLVESGELYASEVVGPPNVIAAPAGYYLLFIVNTGIPSKGVWVRFL